MRQLLTLFFLAFLFYHPSTACETACSPEISGVEYFNPGQYVSYEITDWCTEYENPPGAVGTYQSTIWKLDGIRLYHNPANTAGIPTHPLVENVKIYPNTRKINFLIKNTYQVNSPMITLEALHKFGSTPHGSQPNSIQTKDIGTFRPDLRVNLPGPCQTTFSSGSNRYITAQVFNYGEGVYNGDSYVRAYWSPDLFLDPATDLPATSYISVTNILYTGAHSTKSFTVTVPDPSVWSSPQINLIVAVNDASFIYEEDHNNNQASCPASYSSGGKKIAKNLISVHDLNSGELIWEIGNDRLILENLPPGFYVQKTQTGDQIQVEKYLKH